MTTPEGGSPEAPVTLVASDLDRTLIYSAAALQLTMPDDRAPRLLCVEVYDRAPLCYMTETAAALVGELSVARAPGPVGGEQQVGVQE